MPKQRITKEMVVDAAFEIMRLEGMEQIGVKKIAEKLGCSVQPIYSYCNNMEGLREEVCKKVRNFVGEYVRTHIQKENIFQSTGKSYVRLGKEEPNILKTFVTSERKGVSSLWEMYERETDSKVAGIVAEELGIDVACARELHLHMLIYTMGMSTIFSVASPGVPIDEIFAQQEKAYHIFYEHTKGKKE